MGFSACCRRGLIGLRCAACFCAPTAHVSTYLDMAVGASDAVVFVESFVGVLWEFLLRDGRHFPYVYTLPTKHNHLHMHTTPCGPRTHLQCIIMPVVAFTHAATPPNLPKPCVKQMPSTHTMTSIMEPHTKPMRTPYSPSFKVATDPAFGFLDLAH